ncbi:Vacuolar protein 14 C-terminal Fig4-binding domain-containing protein [Plasmodiophora brassicae]|uniref:Vacuolar protein 14 C-terminal Fig4-binding domain-containing protein n=1 Tax=Plasmodiophora brassicae TaxID=37360 RepID=A0A0G4ISH9_PLABS|nr:hypothetical protein PBRA_006319 [Plasmodiophora brassicae]SPQ95225.1 unnamed protein product [Plasmodiophora brassicae]
MAELVMSTTTPTTASKSPVQSPVPTTPGIVPSAVLRGLSDRSYEKRKSAAMELEQIIRDDPAHSKVKSIIAIMNTDFISSTQSNLRKGGLIGLAAVSIGLSQTCHLFLDDILPPVLQLMQDQEARCRYYACETLYNVTKVTRGHVLKHFNRIYDGLCTLVLDSDPDVRNAVSLLDRLMKDVVTESDSFDIGLFMPMLQERILVKDSAVRGLNVGWIQVLDSIPGIDLLRYLPGVLPGLFGMTADPNAATVAAAEEMLSEFLNEFKASQPDTIEKLLPVLVDQSSSDAPAVAKLMALKWVDAFVAACKSRLFPQYPYLINGLLKCIAETDNDQIRKSAESISQAMMKQVANGSGSFDPLEDFLGQLTVYLNKDCGSTKLPILNWVDMLLQKHADALFKSIDHLLPALIQTLSDPSDHVVQVDLAVLAAVSRNPAHFNNVFVHLITVFCDDDSLLTSRGTLVIRELCALLDAERVYTAIARLLPGKQLEPTSTIVQILNELLLTSSHLFALRQQLQTSVKTPDGVALFETIFRAWSYNPAAALSLCLLCEFYELASAIVNLFADLQITVGFLVDVDRLVVLIESPVFIRMRLHLLEPRSNACLVKALHGLLMVLPSQGSSFKVLSARLQCVSTLGWLEFAPVSRASHDMANAVRADAHPPVDRFVEHYLSIQKQFADARNAAVAEKRVGSSASIRM